MGCKVVRFETDADLVKGMNALDEERDQAVSRLRMGARSQTVWRPMGLFPVGDGWKVVLGEERLTPQDGRVLVVAVTKKGTNGGKRDG